MQDLIDRIEETDVAARRVRVDDPAVRGRSLAQTDDGSPPTSARELSTEPCVSEPEYAPMYYI